MRQCRCGWKHPHAHCILAAGGLSPDHTRWISSSRRFFLPVKVLSRVFRGKFVAGLKSAFHAGTLQFHGSLRHLAEPRTFASWLRTLFRQDWVVYAKRPFGGPQHALRYLGAYTHRVAISNHRLVAMEDGNITFRWRDSAHGNKKKLMTLPVDEFLRRFLLHLLPRGFVRIRHFGFLANRRRGSLLLICFQLLSLAREQAPPAKAVSPTRQSFTWRCPRCGGTMSFVEPISATELLLRSPPQNLGPCSMTPFSPSRPFGAHRSAPGSPVSFRPATTSCRRRRCSPRTAGSSFSRSSGPNRSNEEPDRDDVPIAGVHRRIQIT